VRLVVGLGNIGTRYAHTRHNIGFMVIDQLAKAHNATWKLETKLKAEVARFELEGQQVILAKPQTMMNLSGEAVQRLVQFYKLRPADVWVVFDELDVPFGKLRVRSGGSAGGHQGVRSTIAHIGENFVRVRVGISLNDRATEPSEVYVLKPFNDQEQASLSRVVGAAAGYLASQLIHPDPNPDTTTL
jgi:PTH1 family peptidyl-tRNA hydrolase